MENFEHSGITSSANNSLGRTGYKGNASRVTVLLKSFGQINDSNKIARGLAHRRPAIRVDVVEGKMAGGGA